MASGKIWPDSAPGGQRAARRWEGGVGSLLGDGLRRRGVELVVPGRVRMVGLRRVRAPGWLPS